MQIQVKGEKSIYNKNYIKFLEPTNNTQRKKLRVPIYNPTYFK